MIKCEVCEEYLNEEDMIECPECLKGVCEECYEAHMPICFYVSDYDNRDNY